MTCSIEGCGLLANRKQYCKTHYHRVKNREWYLANKERNKARTVAWYAAHPERAKQLKRLAKRAERARSPELSREACRRYRAAHKPLMKAFSALKKERIRQATPAWADKKALREAWQNCPEGYHVDHIVPLKGKSVSGLNVPWNLQYLPAAENMRKGNKFYG